jgi:hypothetical protein
MANPIALVAVAFHQPVIARVDSRIGIFAHGHFEIHAANKTHKTQIINNNCVLHKHFEKHQARLSVNCIADGAKILDLYKK